MKNPNVILITGASSGIGAAVALEYAQRGVKLLLTGRDATRLAEIEKQCRAKGAAVKTATIDVRDRPALEKQVTGWDDQEPIDLVIANAGISGGDDLYDDIPTTNINGVFHTVQPLLPRMKARGAGQIAVMSSLAGLRGLPNAPAYSVSKVAMRAYGDALRAQLSPDGISVSVIMPGFVHTALTAKNPFRMPFIMDSNKAALAIRKGLERRKKRIAFPCPVYWSMRLTALLPDIIGDAILRWGPQKI